MAVLVENLKQSVFEKVMQSDHVIIISGFVTPDIVEALGKTGVQTEVYFGMYRDGGITKNLHKKLIELDSIYTNLSNRIVYNYRVHTKCYLFYLQDKIMGAFVGSANCSASGLQSCKNSEMLVELDETELKNDSYLQSLDKYKDEIVEASVCCDDSKIIPSKPGNKKSTRGQGKLKVPKSENPLIAYMPLYTIKNGKKTVQKSAGINWGLQKGHVKKGEYAEAYIPIYGEHVDNYPLIFPYFPEERTTESGKTTRKSDPVIVLWDDGVIMEMVFQGGGVQRPPKGKRNVGDPYVEYPKNFAPSSGGEELGRYLRDRMGVPPKKRVVLKDLKNYGRDYITLTYVHPGYYEADFSVK